MTSVDLILKTLAAEFIRSPLTALTRAARRIFPMRKASPQILRMRKISRETPLILQIETTNICNAKCVFCAYQGMIREKGIMSMPMFEKIVGEYAAMGGGPVSLTPVVGDALLDPHLLDRLMVLADCPQVCQKSLTTNGIALDRYSDEQLCGLLERLDCIQVSIGGLERDTYASLYGVDRFPQLQRGLERLLGLRYSVPAPAHITFAFRTNDWRFESRFRKELEEYRRRGVFISHIWMYANYSGLIKSNNEINLAVVDGTANKSQACIYACVHMAVCRDGRITACGCADFEGDALGLGEIEKTSLNDAWFGKKRIGILESFGKGNPVGICRECSAYQPDSAIFSRKFCGDIQPHRPLPAVFFHEFWGG